MGCDDRVAVALSGGPDSVALVWILRELTASGRLGALAGLVHVNHGLRGREADRDEAFCRRLADRLTLPIEVGRCDVAGRARAERRSIESVARDERYQFLAEAAARLGATILATGHTLDDQAETVLLRLLRGAGARGLAAVRIRRGSVVRPLLECRRDELRRYLDSRGEDFCEDSSNLSLAMARNRVRHQLLPVIRELAPGGIRAIARFAALQAEDETYLADRVSESMPAVVLGTQGGVQMNAGRLEELPPALGRRIVRTAIEMVVPSRSVSAGHIDAVLGLAGSSRDSGHLDLAGISVERLGPILSFVRARLEEEAPRMPARGEVPLPVPGCAGLPGGDGSISACALDHAPVRATHDRGEALIQAASVQLPFLIRSRRPGDRLRPLGAPGRRKLQDILVDRKIARDARDRVPIVVDAAGRIVWVAGVTIADECRVTAPSAGVVVLKLNR